MPLLWTPGTIPELGVIKRLPPEIRARVWKASFAKVRRKWQFWAGVAVSIGLFVGVSLLLKRQLADLGLPGFVEGAIGGACAGVLVGTLIAQVTNRLALPYLREELAKVGHSSQHIPG